MTGRGKKPAAPKKKANGYKMPAPIPNGEIINDVLMKKKWRIGPSIGVGGFGEIYSACEHENSPKKGNNYPFVIKIEPHENGPLFVEKHFYVRNANKDDIATFMKSKKLTTFGMPTYFGNGSHEYKGEKYRYLVLERYGKDLWSLFKESGRSFPPATVFQLGLQMLDVLEYIHGRGYVHADIKGANILLGLKKGTEHQAYLVDFGLASRVNDKDFRPDPKCAHNGTIEYTSRDAHLGVSTMRGDLEILGYNMLQWVTGELPWEKSLKQPKLVQDAKEAFMKNVRGSITKHYSHVPDALIKIFEYINTLKPKDVPDYTKCRQIFETYLKSEGKTRNSKLDFSKSSTTSKKLKAKPAVTSEDQSDAEVETPKKRGRSNVVTAKRSKRTERESTPEIDEASINGNAINGDSQSDTEVKENPKKRARNNKAPVKRSKKTVRESTPESDASLTENVEPDNTKKIEPARGRVVKTTIKRKSIEPAVVVKVRKARVAPKRTPPVKKNLISIATQTSAEKPKSPRRQVSFDSPVCQVIDEKKPLKLSKDSSANSSGDIFEDTFVIEDKKINRRKLLSEKEVVVQKIVKKKTTSKAKGSKVRA